MVLNAKRDADKASRARGGSLARIAGNVDLNRAIFEVGSLYDGERFASCRRTVGGRTVYINHVHSASSPVGRDLYFRFDRLSAFLESMHFQVLHGIQSEGRSAGIVSVWDGCFG